ncbi:MAG: MFS transporter, partial [Nocardioidaceae bacterium]
MSTTHLDAVQRRTVRTLSAAQVVGGVGNGAAISVGALLVKDISGSSAWAGLATTMLTLGAAVSALPLAALSSHRGRRPSLTLGWSGSVVGAVLVVVGAEADSLSLTLLGMFVCGFNSATNLQSRYAAADLAGPATVGRSLSIVVWSTTVGAVLGPNLTAPGAAVAGRLGVPPLSGPFVFSAAAWLCGAAIMYVALRPDPLVLAKSVPAPATTRAVTRRGIGSALPIVRRNPAALTGIVTVACA